MDDSKDWRLQGQEKYLKGLTLYFSKYKAYRKDWDHDHCEFCSAKFTETNEPDTLTEGYTTSDSYRWICKPCFEDFKDLFEWKIGGEENRGNQGNQGEIRGRP
jgi:hypothetical protein